MALLLSGDEILVFMAGACLGLVAFPALLLSLWSRPPRNPLIPAIVYFVIASVVYVTAGPSEGLTSFFFAMLIFSPWSIGLTLIATFLERDFSLIGLLFAGALNTILLYVVGKSARSGQDKTALSASVAEGDQH